jgi:hypothetical protein
MRTANIPAAESEPNVCSAPSAPSLCRPYFLTESLLLRWMLFFRQHEGKWPGAHDRRVWDRDRASAWRIVPNERWKSIAVALLSGSRGLVHLRGFSLGRLRRKHGLTPSLAKDQLMKWHTRYLEKERRWPNHTDEVVWQKGPSGAWLQVPDLTWTGISACLACGLSDVDPMSLIQFRRRFVEAGVPDGLVPALDRVGPFLAPTDSGSPSRDSRDAAFAYADQCHLCLSKGEPTRTADSQGLPEEQITGPPLSPPVNTSCNTTPRAGASRMSFPRQRRRNRGRRMTVAQLVRWFQIFYQKEGRCPTRRDRCVWDQDQQRNYLRLERESWSAIICAIPLGLRGLTALKGSTFREFKQQYGRVLTKEQLVKWIRLFHVKEGKWPSTKEIVVWDRDGEDRWLVVPDETWDALNATLRRGQRGLGAFKGQTLSRFRRHQGLDRHLSLEQLLRWMRLHREKEGKWPTQHDTAVWDRDAQNRWIIVKAETWSGLDQAVSGGFRGLEALKGSTLPKLRRLHGLHDDFMAPVEGGSQ